MVSVVAMELTPLGVLWPWLIWNSHHLVVSHFASGFMDVLGHLTMLPIPFMIATSSTSSMLRFYSGTQVWSARAEECSLGLVDGRSIGWQLSRVVNLLSSMKLGSDGRELVRLSVKWTGCLGCYSSLRLSYDERRPRWRSSSSHLIMTQDRAKTSSIVVQLNFVSSLYSSMSRRSPFWKVSTTVSWLQNGIETFY